MKAIGQYFPVIKNVYYVGQGLSNVLVFNPKV